MAAPTLVSVYGFPTLAVSNSGVNFPATVSAAVGDRLVAAVVATDESPPTFSTPTVPSGSGITWTMQQNYSSPAGWCAVYMWTGTVTTAFTSQVISTQAVTGTSNDWATFGVWRWSGSAGIGTSGKNFSNPGDVDVSATLSANSGICMIYGDFNNGAAPTFLTNAGAAVTDLNQTAAGDSRVAAGHHLNSGAAGTKLIGTSAPTSAKATFIYVEVLASGLITATPADPLGITDAVSRVLAASRTAADPLGLTDTATVTQGRSAADPLGMTDAVTITKGRVLNDPLGITDTTSIQKTVNRTIGDPLPMFDNVVAELTRAPIQEFQFVIPNHDPHVPFGHGQAIDVGKFDNGAFTVRTQDSNAPRGDYRMFGTDRRVPPTWAWEMWTNCTSVDEARGWTELLAKVWDDEVRQEAGPVLPLSYRLGGRFRRVYGRPRNFTPSYAKVQLGKVYIVADFALSEDTYYDEDEQTVTGQAVASPGGGSGVILPQALPWVFTAQPVPRTEILTVLGDKETWLTPVFYGPVVNPWVRIGGLTWGLNGSIPASQTVTISGRPWDLGTYRSTGAHAPELLDPRSRLSQLSFKPGTYALTYGGQDATGSSKVVVRWRNAHRTM